MILKLTDNGVQRVPEPRRTPDQRQFIEENIYKQFSSPPTQTNAINLICVCTRGKSSDTRFCATCTELIVFEVKTFPAWIIAACGVGVVLLILIGVILSRFQFSGRNPSPDLGAVILSVHISPLPFFKIQLFEISNQTAKRQRAGGVSAHLIKFNCFLM